MLRWKATAAFMYCSKTLEREPCYPTRYVFGTQTPCTAIHHSLSNLVSVGRKATSYRSKYLQRLNSCTFINSGVRTISYCCKLLRPAWIWFSAAVGSSEVLLIVLWVWNLCFYFQVWSVWGARISRRWTLSNFLHSTDMDSNWTWVRATGTKRKWKYFDSGQSQHDFALESIFGLNTCLQD